MRLVMMGTGGFAEPTFAALLDGPHTVVGLVTQPARGAGRVGGTTRQTGPGLDEVAEARNVPVARPESINGDDGLTVLRNFAPDLLVVAAYGQILSPAVIGVPKLGAINVHASLLPRHRGAAPVAYAILAGDAETGVTIIRINPGLDAGAMLAQEKLAIDPRDTAGSLERRLAPLGARLAAGVIDELATDPNLPGTLQDSTLVTKAPKLKKEFGLIDWTRPAEYLERHARAMQPYPGAYTFWTHGGSEPLRLGVLAAEVAAAETAAPPGQLAGRVGGFPVIATGAGRLVLREVQPAGGKRMGGDAFLRGQRLAEGETVALS